MSARAREGLRVRAREGGSAGGGPGCVRGLDRTGTGCGGADMDDGETPRRGNDGVGDTGSDVCVLYMQGPGLGAAIDYERRQHHVG